MVVNLAKPSRRAACFTHHPEQQPLEAQPLLRRRGCPFAVAVQSSSLMVREGRARCWLLAARGARSARPVMLCPMPRPGASRIAAAADVVFAYLRRRSSSEGWGGRGAGGLGLL